MSSYLIATLSTLAWLAFAIPTLIVLLRLFTTTQIRAFLWLIAALVAWPLIVRGSSFVMPWLVTTLLGSSSAGYMATMFTVVYTVESVIGGALLLTAVVLLERELTARMNPASPPATR